MKLRIALLSSYLFVIAGCATHPQTPAEKVADERAGNDCMFFSSVNNWTVLDRSHLIVWPSSKQPYLVDTAFPIEDLPWASGIAFIDGDHNGMLCGYGMDEIAIPHSNWGAHATIASIRRVDPAELEKLGEQYHVALTRKPPKQTASADDKEGKAAPADHP